GGGARQRWNRRYRRGAGTHAHPRLGRRAVGRIRRCRGAPGASTAAHPRRHRCRGGDACQRRRCGPHRPDTHRRRRPGPTLRPRARLDGLHHVTAITADVATNLDFYGRLLGLRLVWQGVNADDPQMRHIAYGDEYGTPGSILTFFDMPGASHGQPGMGMVHRLLLRVANDEALDFWERRLTRAGVASERHAGRLL